VRRLIALLSAAALTTTAALAAVAAPAQAVPGFWVYNGASGGTQIYALGTAVTSGLTASSNLAGDDYPAAHQTEVASVSVPHLAVVGVVTSGQAATAIPGGYQISSRAQTASVNLLDGLITADALDTTGTARVVDGVASASANTKFVHLKVGSIFVPLNVAPNTTLNILNVAKVVINESKAIAMGGAASVKASAIHVTLLKPMNGAPAGAEIFVDPVMATILPKVETGSQLIGGRTFGLFAGVGVGTAAKVLIQPAGELTMPPTGTNGVPFTNNVAGVNIKNVATIGAVNTTIQGLSTVGFGSSLTRAEIAKVNLLNGLITADAIEATALTYGSTDPFYPPADFVVKEPSLRFVNLTIAGKPIAINVKPNTLINVLGIAKIYINQQINTAHSTTVVGLRIVLSTAKYGLPIGAEIDVAMANSFIGTYP
jgi:hypothetical protein